MRHEDKGSFLAKEVNVEFEVKPWTGVLENMEWKLYKCIKNIMSCKNIFNRRRNHDLYFFLQISVITALT